MNGEQKLLAVIFVMLFGSAAAVAWAVAWYNVRSVEEFTRNGYSESTVPGRSDIVWVKSRQPEEFVPPPPPWPPETETVIHVPLPPAPVEGESVEVLP